MKRAELAIGDDLSPHIYLIKSITRVGQMTEEVINAPLATAEISTGMAVSGKVTYIGVYGAMIDIGGQEALLHPSQLGRSDIRNIEDLFKIGEEVNAYVLKVDNEGRVALTMEKPPELTWNRIQKGEVYTGTVTRIEDYGAFVDIGAERPGMVHVSELTDGYVQSPNDVVKVGQMVEVRVIKLNRRNRQIDLSMKTPVEEIQQVMEPAEEVPNAMEMAFRRAQKQPQRDRRGGMKKDRRRDDYDLDDVISRTLRNHSS
jgi:small subunit ribosomal protein S1